jgi:predicted nucleic acid-binding protein
VLIYLDSNIVIYLIEQPVQFGPLASSRVSARVAAGDTLVVSDLTRLECRASPMAAGDQVTVAQYDAFFAQGIGRVVPLTTAVCDRATIFRGRYRFKTPDALHLAAAVEASCDVFLTNDARLSSFPDITIEVLS